jgi:hypothetical protein|tara:strand:+ start:3339 stop:3551 length:213 start_codon:yes stop_codon:yes gene_type:complete
MKIVQDPQTGAAKFTFSEKEIKIIKKKKELVFSVDDTSQLCQILVHTGIKMQEGLPPEKQNIRDDANDII